MSLTLMFKQTFINVLSRLTADQALVDKLLKEIELKYSTSGRFYHNMSHLDHLIAELYPLKDQIEDWETVILSVAYHDIVYNPLKKDNEVRSAYIAGDRLNKLNVPGDRIEKCREQILSTRMHAASENPDTNYFTDADLSILGAVPELYLEYAHRVRKEYKYFPNLLYKPGRKKVLMRFLGMTNIFKTKHFQDKCEAQARFNLTNELNSLS